MVSQLRDVYSVVELEYRGSRSPVTTKENTRENCALARASYAQYASMTVDVALP